MDINDIIRQSVAEVLAESRGESQLPAAPVAPAPQPITVNIGGQPVTFRDQADLEAQLNAAAEALRAQQAAAVPPPQPQGTNVKDDSDTGFNNEEYIRLMNEDPRKATNYALSHVLFDGKVDNPAELIRESMVAAAESRRQLAVYQFRDSHREIPLENPQVANTISNIQQQLGLPFTPQGLEAAYAFAVQKGALPDFRQVVQNGNQQQPQQNQQFGGYQTGQNYGQPQAPQQNFYPNLPAAAAPTNPYLAPPPAPGRSNAPSVPLTTGDLEDMSADEIKRLIDKLSAQGIQ